MGANSNRTDVELAEQWNRVDGDYAPYWLVALRAAADAIEKHDLWCGHKKGSPGDGSINRAERLVGIAIRRAEAALRIEALAREIELRRRVGLGDEDRRRRLGDDELRARFVEALANDPDPRD